MEKNYIIILTESLEKKLQVLDKISTENLSQRELLKSEDFDMEAFETSVDRKSELIEQISFLDEGFETMYERVREALNTKKQSYQEEIATLKKLISAVTEKSVIIQKQEQENRVLAEAQFSREKKKVQQIKNSRQVTSQYYKNMAKLNYVEPQFMDKKK